MAVTIEQLEKWMQSAEGERLEFKSAKSEWNQAKLNRYCVALCNEGGGKLILGVNDDKPRKVVGSKAFLDLNDTKSKIFDKLRIRVDIDETWFANGRVITFHIPPRAPGTPIHYDGSYLMRVGEDLVLTCSPKITPGGMQESNRIKKGDSCYEEGTYG